VAVWAIDPKAGMGLAPGRALFAPASEGGRNQHRQLPLARVDAGSAGGWRRASPDLRHVHTFATWSLATGMSIFTLARRMGTSVQMIDRTYGHLAQDAEDQDRDLLDAYDAASIGRGHDVGTLTELAKVPTRTRHEKSSSLLGF
jgi:integrase